MFTSPSIRGFVLDARFELEETEGWSLRGDGTKRWLLSKRVWEMGFWKGRQTGNCEQLKNDVGTCQKQLYSELIFSQNYIMRLTTTEFIYSHPRLNLSNHHVPFFELPFISFPSPANSFENYSTVFQYGVKFGSQLNWLNTLVFDQKEIEIMAGFSVSWKLLHPSYYILRAKISLRNWFTEDRNKISFTVICHQIALFTSPPSFSSLAYIKHSSLKELLKNCQVIQSKTLIR